MPILFVQNCFRYISNLLSPEVREKTTVVYFFRDLTSPSQLSVRALLHHSTIPFPALTLPILDPHGEVSPHFPRRFVHSRHRVIPAPHVNPIGGILEPGDVQHKDTVGVGIVSAYGGEVAVAGLAEEGARERHDEDGEAGLVGGRTSAKSYGVGGTATVGAVGVCF